MTTGQPITMYDTAWNDQFPDGGHAYAAYVDGTVGDQPNYGYIVASFPQANHLAITLDPSRNDATCLDVETRAASPESAADWYRRQKARGITRPCIYASASVMEANIIPVITAAQFPRAEVRLWSAHYGAGAHICAPATCGLVSMPMDGTQWTSTALGKNLDQSLLDPGFFTVPPPANWTYAAPGNLHAIGGHTSVRLNWDAPAGAPVPPAEYMVWVYAGVTAERATLVPTYPRPVTPVGPKDAPATTFEGGGLETGQLYTAHVAASGSHGTHEHPYTYESVTFTTG